jgi:ATP-dependent DNA helicase RecQ
VLTNCEKVLVLFKTAGMSDALGSDPVLSAVERMGKSSLRGKQRDAIDAIMRHEDVLYVFPTGTAKSLVYEVAALCSDGVSVIVSPLLGLLQEQVQRIASRGIAAIERYGDSFACYGTQEDSKLIYTTPEQLHAGSSLRAHICENAMKITRIVVDEAHLVYEWDDFRYVLVSGCLCAIVQRPCQ